MEYIKMIKFTVLLLLYFGVQCAKPLGRRETVPVIYVKGCHYEVGFEMGRVFASLIKEYIATYESLRGFEKQYQTEIGRAAYDKTLANMKKRFPQYVNEMQGISDGANVPFYQLFLLHMDDIIDTINDPPTVVKNDTGGCTSIGINSCKHTILGHTEDASFETLNHFYIVSAHIIPTPEDKKHGATEERFASLCYAGNLPGYTSGFNENGLVFSINTLSPSRLKPGHTPRTFITRSLLASKNFNDAQRIIRDEGLGIANGFSVNMIWTDEKRSFQMYNLEVAPDLKADKSLINIQKYDKEPLTHCNLYQRLNVSEVVGPIIESSLSRIQLIQNHPPPRNKADIQDILSDTSGKTVYQIFQDSDDFFVRTISVGIFDMEKYTWSLYINKPNISEPIAVLPITFPGLTKRH